MRKIARWGLNCLGLQSVRYVEYRFVTEQLRKIPSSSVLDIGGCDSILPRWCASNGHTVTVYDVRPFPIVHPKIRAIQGDFNQDNHKMR